MIEIKDKEMCCGCAVCANVCPQKCISMHDDEEGFSYPQVDTDKCVDCGLCEKRCPILRNKRKENKDVGFYIARAKDKSVLNNSTSGGFVSPIARYVFENNGVVCGAILDKYGVVRHQVFEREEEDNAIVWMRGSKYVQSELGSVYSQIKQHLNSGKMVCFVGTPCQVHGLYSYLNIRHENLTTIELACHGVPSPRLWKKYLEYQQYKYRSNIVSVSFRDKTYGYHSSAMKLVFANGRKYIGTARVDYMLKSFFSEICSRPSCYNCQFKGLSSLSDFTIYDCWQPEKVIAGFKDDNCGYTNVITHTARARMLLEDLKNSYELYSIENDRAIPFIGRMVLTSAKPHKSRALFYKELNEYGLKKTIRRYIPVTTKDRLIELIKPIAYKLGLYETLKKRNIKKK